MAHRRMSLSERRTRLARRHLLAPGHQDDHVGRVADALVGLHSADPVSVYPSAAARMVHPSLDAVDRALYEDRVIVRHHAMRRTLWVMTPEMVRLAHATSSRRVAATERQRLLALLAANDVAPDVEAWLADAQAQILDVLRRKGQATAKELGDELPALRAPLQVSAGKPYEAVISAHTRVLVLLGFEGVVVRTRPVGTWVSSQYRWAVMSEWVDGGLGEVDERDAAAELARRWLRSFGPATTEDLRWWTGWTLGAVRRALADIEAVEIELAGGQAAWLDVRDARDARIEGDEARHGEAAGPPWVALLPGLDPTTMGWKQRDWYLTPEHAPRVFDRNGNGGPTVWADGRVVGGWAQRPDGSIRVRLLDDLGQEHRDAIDAAAGRLEALLGPARTTVRFRSPLHLELLA